LGIGRGTAMKKGDIFTYAFTPRMTFVAEYLGNSSELGDSSIDSSGYCKDLASTEEYIVEKYHLSALFKYPIKKIDRKDLILFSNLKYKTARYFELLTS
jgi:hypothetical protein